MITIALVGIGGYGGVNLRMLQKYVPEESYKIVAVVDPFAKTAPAYESLVQQNIPFYDTLEEFYRQGSADLCIISTPIPCHKPQIITSFAHGSHVMCEKPLATSARDIEEISAAAAKYGKKLGVGFQWSFCDAILHLKADIAKGIYGKPTCFRTKICWPRQKEYYAGSSWKGRLHDKDGNVINDSIASNATAHYIQNMLYVNGCELNDLHVLTARANDIETFDTCIIDGTAENGCRVFFAVTHAGKPLVNPTFRYEFTGGHVEYNQNIADDMIGYPDGGEPIHYGALLTEEAQSHKIQKMVKAVENDEPIVCSIGEVMPVSKLFFRIFENLHTQVFPKERITDAGDILYVDGLWEELEQAYDTLTVPEKL